MTRFTYVDGPVYGHMAKTFGQQFNKRIMLIVMNYLYPKEHFIEIEHQPEFIARITLNQIGDAYNSEIDILLEESRKIYFHVGDLYNISEETEALELSVQKLAKFLRGSK